MTIIHKQLALEETEPGMVLADDLFDPQGQVLLPKGAILTEQIIASLARHEIAAVRIEMGQMTPEEEAAQHSYFSERIEMLFRKKDASPATDMLHRYIRAYRLGEKT